MTPPLFQELRPGRSACPSDLALDRHAAGETQADEEPRIRAHVAGCPHCAAHLAERRFEALPGGAAMLARVRARAGDAAIAQERRRGWLRRLPVLALAAAGLAAGVLVIVRPPSSIHTGETGETGVRDKGAPVLHVHRQTQQGSEEILSGATLAPGTALRFVVDLPAAGFVSILGVEARGGLYTAWPMPGEQAGDPAATRRSAGAGQALPGAVVLDESLGREVLYLIHCPAAPPRCAAGEAGAPPRCQEGCARAPFVIVKRGP